MAFYYSLTGLSDPDFGGQVVHLLERLGISPGPRRPGESVGFSSLLRDGMRTGGFWKVDQR